MKFTNLSGDGSRFALGALVAAAVSLSVVAGAAAQGFPNSPIKLIAPFPPGGGVDLTARLLSSKLRDSFHQPVVVENITGATGQIGVERVAKAKPDGYTAVVAASAAITINLHLTKLGYDPVKDLAPITMLVTSPTALAVNASLPVNTLQEFLAYARANPGKVSYSTSGVGSQLHVAGELLKQRTGIDMVAVAYKGTLPATAAIVSGEVQAGISDLPTLLPHAAANRIKILAITDAARSSSAPNIPTVAESGVPNFVAGSWLGLFTTGGTPPDIVAKWHTDVAALLRTPEMQKALQDIGLEAAPNKSADEFGAFVRSEISKWGEAITSAKIKLDQPSN